MNVVPPLADISLTPRQTAIRALFDRLAPQRAHWLRRNSYFYEADHAYMRFLIPAGARVLEIGCGDGQLLAALKPSRAVGVDLSPEMIRVAPGVRMACGQCRRTGGFTANFGAV